MIRSILIHAFWFAVGAIATATPFLVHANVMNADELARGEQTMGPGITIFLGLLAAPVGGTVVVIVCLWLERRKRRDSVRQYGEGPRHG